MATRRRTARLLVVLLGLGSTLLAGDALPQGYQPRYRRDHRCPTCPRDCSEKLSGNHAEIIIDYPPPKPPRKSPHPTPASYVTAPPQPPPAQYSAPPPEPQPQYAAPPPEPQPQYSAPPPQPQPQCSAPPPPAQPAYSVPPPPQPQPQYSAPPPPAQPAYSVPPPPQPQPQYSALPPPVQPYQPIALPAYPPPPPTRYLPELSPPCSCPDCPADFDPYEYPGFDYDCGYRYGRSLDADDEYPMFSKYNRRSLDANNKRFTPRKEYRPEPLPFADESSPPADFYKNYKPYVRESVDRREYESVEQPTRRSPGNERERLFVVYRADAPDDKPSGPELESVIRQAMEVARQQKTQEDFAFNARKAKSAKRYRYEHEKYQDATERVDFEALKEDDADAEVARFNLSPGPLMNVGETYVTEEGDDQLNPGLDQNNWTVVPSLSDLTLVKPQELEDVEEIEAAVSVVTEMPKTKNVKVPKVVQKAVDAAGAKDKVKKHTIEVIRPGDVEMKSEMVPEFVGDMQTPTSVTEATKFEGPVESPVTSAPTTNASVS